MSRILSIEPIKKNSALVRVELSSGEVYLIGFWGLAFVEAPEIYGRILQHMIDSFEASEETDLKSYLQGIYSRAKDDSLLYVIPETIGERERIGRMIRDLRTAKGLEAKKLATIANIDPANISRIEQGKYSVGSDILCRIAAALDSRVEIVPIAPHSGKGNQMSLARNVWVIPTLDTNFYPYATFPGCGFNLWPNTHEANIQIGDIAIFYITQEKRYSDPVLITAIDFKYEQLGKDEWVFPHLSKSGNQDFIKITDCPDFSDTDAIRIKEALRNMEETPTRIMVI